MARQSLVLHSAVPANRSYPTSCSGMRRADVRVASQAVGTAEAGAQALDGELGKGDAPRRGNVEAARVGRCARRPGRGPHLTVPHLSPPVRTFKPVY